MKKILAASALSVFAMAMAHAKPVVVSITNNATNAQASSCHQQCKTDP